MCKIVCNTRTKLPDSYSEQNYLFANNYYVSKYYIILSKCIVNLIMLCKNVIITTNSNIICANTCDTPMIVLKVTAYVNMSQKN
jgi:hypothetical protein